MSPGVPRPFTRMRWPSSTPAGMRTFTVRGRTSIPRPLQFLHLSLTTLPRPPQVGQTSENENGPWSTATEPAPLHVGQRSGNVPGLAPVPLHT